MAQGHAVTGPVSSWWPGMGESQPARHTEGQTETQRKGKRKGDREGWREGGGEARARHSLQEHTHTDLFPLVRPYSEVSSNSPGEYKPAGTADVQTHNTHTWSQGLVAIS